MFSQVDRGELHLDALVRELPGLSHSLTLPPFTGKYQVAGRLGICPLNKPLVDISSLLYNEAGEPVMVNRIFLKNLSHPA